MFENIAKLTKSKFRKVSISEFLKFKFQQEISSFTVM